MGNISTCLHIFCALSFVELAAASTTLLTVFSPGTDAAILPSWVSGKARISITPHKSGYLLGDLQKYMNIISTMHAHYDDYFEWRGELIRTKVLGIVVKVGTCSMSRDP